MKVLVADDDRVTRCILVALLQKDDIEVVEAENGAIAWQILLEPDPPQLLLIDWIMPEMSGIEVIQRIRATEGDHAPYVIMVTSNSEQKEVVAGLNAGANDYLTKPFNTNELRARIQVGKRMLELQNALSLKITELNETLDHIRTLRGIVPICASCKKIRDDHGYWNQLEVYVRDHTEAEFSHGFCPECMKKLYDADA